MWSPRDVLSWGEGLLVGGLARVCEYDNNINIINIKIKNKNYDGRW